jgi:hypothetical protein
MIDLNSLITKIERKDAELSRAKRKYKDSFVRIRKIKSEIENHEKAKQTVMFVAQNTIQKTKDYLENSVTLLLQSLFGKKFKAKIVIKTRNDQQEAFLYLDKKGILMEIRKDVTAVGEIDVFAYGLRMASWSLEGAEPIIFSDEPFKNLSKYFLPKMGIVLKELTDRFKMQQIIITHKEEVIETADNIISIDN